MNLTLVAVSLNDQPLSQPITAVFDSRGGTIGRADHNTMALPDPQRHISRLQAEIVVHGAAYIIRNVGASNPIVVNGRNLAHGDTAALSQNEQVRMGGYLLKAHLGPASASDASAYAHRPQDWAQVLQAAAPGVAADAEVRPATAAASAATGASSHPSAAAVSGSFTDLFGTADSTPASDPFGGLLGPSPAPTARRNADTPTPAWGAGRPSTNDPFADLMPPPAGVHPRSQAVAAPAASASLLPDDFDVFAAPHPSQNHPPAGSHSNAGFESAFHAAGTSSGASAGPASAATPYADPLADIVQSASATASIDDLFRLDAGAGTDPLALFLQDNGNGLTSAAAANATGICTDPLALFAPAAPPATHHSPATPLRTAPLQMAQADNTPAVHSAFVPPRVAPAAPVVAAATPTASSAPTASTAPTAIEAAHKTTPDAGHHSPIPKDLWAAFCSGAGIETIHPTATPEQQMQALGRILRSAVDGTLQLMAVRASTKHELRAGVTIIQQRNNNPLKFSPDAGSALTQLLNPPLRGFLDGPAAMDDAMHDLVGHSIGTVAGLRAAVEGMLDRFAPQALQSKLSSHSVFDNLLPAARKARLWDLYTQHHAAIHEEAQEDFHTLFGKAFLAAYEQQIERLKNGTVAR